MTRAVGKPVVHSRQEIVIRSGFTRLAPGMTTVFHGQPIDLKENGLNGGFFASAPASPM
jgi:hypothetical protein